MTPAESPRRIHLVTALVVAGVFVAGVVTGAGVLRSFGHHAEPPPSPTPSLPPPLPAARLPRELRLTPDQEAKARDIGERYRPELDALAREIRPKVRAVQDRMESEFVALLTPEQKAQLAGIEERRRQPPGPAEPASSRQSPSADGSPRASQAPPRQRPPPQEAIDACQHLDLDQLCRFTFDGREHEGSCRGPPDGQGPISCAPDRHMEPPPPEDRSR